MDRRTVVLEVRVLREGELQVFEQLEVLDDDGVVIARGEQRGRIVWPGDSLDGEPPAVAAVAGAVHTSELVALHADVRALAELEAQARGGRAAHDAAAQVAALQARVDAARAATEAQRVVPEGGE